MYEDASGDPVEILRDPQRSNCVAFNDTHFARTSIPQGWTFEQGADNDVILIRTCAVVDLILPFSGFGLNLVRDDTGGMPIVAASVFVNEPS